jgi:hypothetical protein
MSFYPQLSSKIEKLTDEQIDLFISEVEKFLEVLKGAGEHGQIHSG